ncbi:MAG: carbohydrate-binding protein, partial [Oscillospiraceae bacterium]|nr:carbohydrate-binding protein [Oscillospiraceae bacterium]
NGGRLELHLDTQDGRLIGTVDISGTGGWQNWQDFSCEITGAEGIHDLYFTFAGEGTLPLYNLDWWQFADSSEAARIRGDVNGDGIINAVDLTLAKRGILNGFADRAAEKAADVDRNQITDAKDIAWFRQYLLVETSAYPDAGDDKTPA